MVMVSRGCNDAFLNSLPPQDFSVYGVSIDSSGITQFLLYYDGVWMWKPADNFCPDPFHP